MSDRQILKLSLRKLVSPRKRRLESQTIIGRGTWLDRVASEVVAREKALGGVCLRFRVESGLGASGIPHIGSLGDAARAYGIKMALEEAGLQLRTDCIFRRHGRIKKSTRGTS